ncbi:MAG TPA: FHA domain-containing protein [Ktedonobacterales bacterium]|nr:FHA domain-containing protein [Ktedonobacterales bacterium]
MDGSAFPTWMGVGGYVGLSCAMVAAAAVAVWAIVYRRGAPRQSAMAILICLLCAVLMILPLWWQQSRFQFFGSSLGGIEVALVLTWISLFGWTLPLGMLASFIALAEPNKPIERRGPRRSPLLDATLRLALADPARYVSVRRNDEPWAQLAVVGDVSSKGVRTLLLRKQLTLIGREADNDIILDDERISRHHAEIRMDHGIAVLLDYGSMNGTLINRQMVTQPIPLKPDDIVDLGTRSYRFLLIEGPFATVEDETSRMPGAGGMNRRQTLPPVSPPTLVAINGELTGARWELLEPVTAIGRDASCQIRLPDSTVSRRHAQVVRQADGYYASDVESVNGTKVNVDVLTKPHRLQHGDLLHVGEVALRFVSSMPPLETPTPPPNRIRPPSGGKSSSRTTIPFSRGAVLRPMDEG